MSMAPLLPGSPHPCDLWSLDEDAIDIYDVDGNKFVFDFGNPDWYPEYWRRVVVFDSHHRDSGRFYSNRSSAIRSYLLVGEDAVVFPASNN